MQALFSKFRKIFRLFVSSALQHRLALLTPCVSSLYFSRLGRQRTKVNEDNCISNTVLGSTHQPA